MNGKKFLSELCNLAELSNLKKRGHVDLSGVDQRFKDALLSFGSETEDNISCVEEIEFAELAEGDSKITIARGLSLKRSGYSVADVLHHAEGCLIPEAVKEEFPQLSQSEWDATLRLVVLILSAAES